MTQVDVANLRKDEVDWKAGRIRRKRSKTRNNNGVPEVNYKLWDETFQLLCTHQTQDHPELVLTTAKGDSLHATETKTSGKGRLYKRDVIGRQYARLRDRLKRPLRPLKSLRKTSATKLDKNAEYARYTQHFLGHSPRSVADRHYKKPDGEQFDQTVKWLGEQFGFPTTR